MRIGRKLERLSAARAASVLTRNVHGIEFAPDRFERMDVSVLALTFVKASEGNAAGSEPSPGATS
jgi:hypothetical protein